MDGWMEPAANQAATAFIAGHMLHLTEETKHALPRVARFQLLRAAFLETVHGLV
jgi:hypothetical protein